MTTETIDKLFFELSQVATAKTVKELSLQTELHNALSVDIYHRNQFRDLLFTRRITCSWEEIYEEVKRLKDEVDNLKGQYYR